MTPSTTAATAPASPVMEPPVTAASPANLTSTSQKHRLQRATARTAMLGVEASVQEQAGRTAANQERARPATRRCKTELSTSAGGPATPLESFGRRATTAARLVILPATHALKAAPQATV